MRRRSAIGTAISRIPSSRSIPAADYRESILKTTRDALYGWTAERMVRKQTMLGQRAYLYLWDHGYPAADAAGLHAFHASELPFVFGTAALTTPQWPAIPDTPGEHALSDAMLDYWASFVRRRQAGRGGGTGLADVRCSRGVYAFHYDARAQDEASPRHVCAQRDGDVCARRRRARSAGIGTSGLRHRKSHRRAGDAHEEIWVLEHRPNRVTLAIDAA